MVEDGDQPRAEAEGWQVGHGIAEHFRAEMTTAIACAAGLQLPTEAGSEDGARRARASHPLRDQSLMRATPAHRSSLVQGSAR